MRICTSPDYAVEGRSRRNEGTTGYEPKRVRANYVVTICNQFNKGLVASLLLTMITISSIMRDMQESIAISYCESTIPTLVRSDHSCVLNLEQRFSTFNKCFSPNALTRFRSDGHCPDSDQRLCVQIYVVSTLDGIRLPQESMFPRNSISGLMKHLRSKSEVTLPSSVWEERNWYKIYDLLRRY